MNTLLGDIWRAEEGVTQTLTPRGAESLTEPELVGKIQLNNLPWESLKLGQ